MLLLNLPAFENKKYSEVMTVSMETVHMAKSCQERTTGNKNARIYLKAALPYNKYLFNDL